MWTLKSLYEHCNECRTEINDKWVPARPLPTYGWYGVKERFRAALAVFNGKADAFTWPEGQ